MLKTRLACKRAPRPLQLGLPGGACAVPAASSAPLARARLQLRAVLKGAGVDLAVLEGAKAHGQLRLDALGGLHDGLLQRGRQRHAGRALLWKAGHDLLPRTHLRAQAASDTGGCSLSAACAAGSQPSDIEPACRGSRGSGSVGRCACWGAQGLAAAAAPAWVLRGCKGAITAGSCGQQLARPSSWAQVRGPEPANQDQRSCPVLCGARHLGRLLQGLRSLALDGGQQAAQDQGELVQHGRLLQLLAGLPQGLRAGHRALRGRQGAVLGGCSTVPTSATQPVWAPLYVAGWNLRKSLRGTQGSRWIPEPGRQSSRAADATTTVDALVTSACARARHWASRQVGRTGPTLAGQRAPLLSDQHQQPAHLLDTSPLGQLHSSAPSAHASRCWPGPQKAPHLVDQACTALSVNMHGSLHHMLWSAAAPTRAPSQQRQPDACGFLTTRMHSR